MFIPAIIPPDIQPEKTKTGVKVLFTPAKPGFRLP